mmetsp:Transcript_137420/g.342774  ORF Transcript_137420/g.342774 Transcript_137420/m.342774 type:complete len:374 (+) Transcript_137420:135-1256(+)
MVRNGGSPGVSALSPKVFLALLGRAVGDDVSGLLLTSPPPPEPTLVPPASLALGSPPLPSQQVDSENTYPGGGPKPDALDPQNSISGVTLRGQQFAPQADSRDPLSTFIFSDLPMALGYLTGLVIACVALWACCRCCRSGLVGKTLVGEHGVGRSAPVRRNDYAQVSASERDGLLSPPPPSGDGDGSSSGDDVLGAPIVFPLLAPLREFGMALKEKFIQREFSFSGVAGQLLSKSARVGRPRPNNSQDEDCRRELYRRGHDSGDEEEACGLLQGEHGGHDEDDHEPPSAWGRGASPLHVQKQQSSHSSASRSPARSPARSRLQIDDGDDEDEAAVAALMKLRPAACDSVGGEEDDDEVTAPLVGSERASFLSR